MKYSKEYIGLRDLRTLYTLSDLLKSYLVFQHLHRSGLYRTHEAFKSECEDLDIPIQQISSMENVAVPGRRATLISENTVQELLKAFDDAKQDLFFKVYIILTIDRLIIILW